MRRKPEYCDHYTTQDTPSFGIKIGDCTRPICGRFAPTRCIGICSKYSNLSHRVKLALRRENEDKKIIKVICSNAGGKECQDCMHNNPHAMHSYYAIDGGEGDKVACYPV